MASKRVVFRVKWDKNSSLWILSMKGPDGEVSPIWASTFLKNEVVRDARGYVRDYRKDHGGVLAQLVVHAKDHRICFEATYGKDPKRSKG